MKRTARAALHKESSQGMLEGSDGTVRIGKGCLKMSQHLRRRRLRRFGWRFRRLALLPQRRADLALAEIESFPDPLHLPVAQVAVDAADGRADAVRDHSLEKRPQPAGREAQPSDFVRDPDAERPPAAPAIVAVAAEDSPGADCLSLRVALIIASQKAVQNQQAGHLAMRARCRFELLVNREPLLRAPRKPLPRLLVPRPRGWPERPRRRGFTPTTWICTRTRSLSGIVLRS